MSWLECDEHLRDDIYRLLNDETKQCSSELNSIIQLLADGLPDYERCEQIGAAMGMLDQVEEAAKHLKLMLHKEFGCKGCASLGVPLEDGLCGDCTKNQQQKGEADG